jgi:minor extracellular serine protease Vpr
LTYASPTQVNVQVPWELQGQSAAQVKVTINYTNGNVITIPLSDFAPALFEASPGAAAALDGNFRLITASNPARRGQVVQLFANGLGPVNNQPATGDPAPASPLATTKSIAVVSIGGQPAQVLFSGLAPGFAGLYQVNVTVPPSVATGSQPVTIMIGGRTSKASGIVVQ